MTELLFCMKLCAITVQWSLTALRRGRKRERDKDRQRERERERESMCVQEEWDRRQLTPPLLLLPAEWGVLHFLRAMQRTRKKRLTSVKVTIQQTQSRAADTESLRRTEKLRGTETLTERDRWTDRQRDRWAAAFGVMPLLSNVLHKYSASRRQRTEVGMNHLHTPKICAHVFQFHRLIVTVLWLDVFVC